MRANDCNSLPVPAVVGTAIMGISAADFTAAAVENGASRMELAKRLIDNRIAGLPAGGFEYAWWDLPTTTSGSGVGQAHAVALTHSAANQTLTTLAELGLQTVRTVSTSLSLLAAAQRVPIDPRRIAAVLDIGSRRAHLVLMYAGRVVHERALPDFDLAALRQRLVESLGINASLASRALGRFGINDDNRGAVACETDAMIHEAMAPLIEEISMSFAYVSHLYPEADLGPLLLAGGGANIDGLAKAISAVLEIDSMPVTPTQLLTGDGFGDAGEDPALCAAVGAAMIGGGES